jgi:hypothetical protein
MEVMQASGSPQKGQAIVQAYGMATWDCFRKSVQDGGLQLQKIVQLAESVGGKNHGFR